MRNRSAVLLLVAALLLPACGDDDNDSGSDGAGTQATTQTDTQPDTGAQDGSVTRTEYIAEADAFCKKANAEAKVLNERAQDAVRGATGTKAQLEAIAPLLREGYEVQARSREEFKKIEYPAADRAIVEQLHAAYDKQTALVAELRDAAEAGDAARFRSVSTEQNRVKTTARRIAQDYGFKECGSGKNEAD